jgi:RNA polymerase sigma-70 factor, ECF subfamily
VTVSNAREQRFLDLVHANSARLARLARAYAGADWQDLRQDILLQVWRGIDRFEGRSAASTWLYRVALNTALTWRRRAGSTSNRMAPAADPPPDPAGELGPRDPLQVLDDFLGTLAGVDRAILLLYLEDTTYAEIAEVTGLSEGNVGVRINRLKRTFVERYIGGR